MADLDMVKRLLSNYLNFFKYLTFFLMVGVSPTIAEDAIFATIHFPPYMINAEGQPPSGSSVDIVSAVSADAGVGATIQFYPWKRALETARSGKASALFGCAVVSERKKDFLISDPLGRIRYGFFYGSSFVKRSIKKLEDLRGLRVGVISGYYLEADLKSEGIDYLSFNSEETALKLLQDQRIDVVYGYYGVLNYIKAIQEINFVSSFSEYKSQDYAVCFPKGLPSSVDLRERFNGSLKKLKEQGVIEKIKHRYGLN